MINLSFIKAILAKRFPHLYHASRDQWRAIRGWGMRIRSDIARFANRGRKDAGPPCGRFSTLEQLRAEGREDQIILTGQKGPKVSADSISVRSLGQHLDQTNPILWRLYHNARLVSRSLALVDEQKRLNLESTYGAKYTTSDPAYLAVHLPEPVHLPGRWTSVISRWVPSDEVTNYAHWLYDALPRLNLLKYFPDDVGILIPGPVRAYHEETLKILGVWERCRPTPETHLTVEEYYFSSPVSMIVCWSPYAYDFLNETIRPAGIGSPDTPKRFYIVRRGVSRGALNDDQVVRFFESIGWATIDTAAIPFREQINLFANAEAICGLHGAGLVNMQWSKPGTHVIEIFPATFLSGGNEMIALYLKLRYKAMIYPANGFNQATVDLEHLRHYLTQQGLVD